MSGGAGQEGNDAAVTYYDIHGLLLTLDTVYLLFIREQKYDFSFQQTLKQNPIYSNLPPHNELEIEMEKSIIAEQAEEDTDFLKFRKLIKLWKNELTQPKKAKEEKEQNKTKDGEQNDKKDRA